MARLSLIQLQPEYPRKPHNYLHLHPRLHSPLIFLAETVQRKESQMAPLGAMAIVSLVYYVVTGYELALIAWLLLTLFLLFI